MASFPNSNVNIFWTRTNMDVYVRHSMLVLALCLAASGCKGTDSSIELLESELRWMEDQLYLMDRELAYAHAKLDSSQRYNDALKKELQKGQASGDDRAGSPADQAPTIEDDTFDESDLVVPEIDLGSDAGEDAAPQIDAPQIDESGPTDADSNMGTPDNGNSNGAPPEGFRDSTEPMPERLPADATPDLPDDDSLNLEDITRHEVRASDIRVARIVLNSRLSGGYDFDGKPGDDGLLLVIEPQNTSGQYLPLPGDLTITVEDPRRSGVDARVARWDFNAVETVDLMKKTLLGRGIHLKLPWPNQPPNQPTLRVYATYRATDGRQLDATRNIKLDLGVDSIVGQTPAAPFETRLIPEERHAAREEPSISSLPAPPRAPSLLGDPEQPSLLGDPEQPSRLAHQPWQPTRPKKGLTPREHGRSQPTTQPKWRPYR